MIEIEAKIRSKKIIELYFRDMKSEYESFQNCLPDKCSRILDIGCGIAGIDVFLNEHYSDKTMEFYLLDKSEVAEDVYYSYKEKGAFYNSLNLAKAVLVNAGIDQNHVHLIEATEHNDINTNCNMDLVLSLISWGFHYPIGTYLDKVYNLLNEGGKLILDIRKGTDGLKLISNRFTKYRSILETNKFIRICAAKS